MIEETTEVVVNTLDSKLIALVDDIAEEQDPSKTKDLVDLFNWHISKKNIARIKKLSDLYDSLTDQMVERVEKRADQFSNSDLLDYMKTIQTAMDTNAKNLTTIQEPPLIVNQTNTQINVNLADTFDRDAKERILAAVQATLGSINNPIETTAEIIDETSEHEEQ